jgi:ribosomal protein L40E
MITCPACGKENEDSAFECRRCRAPLREEVPEEAPAGAASSDVGTVCRRCEAFNEPGVRVCSACGYDLFAEALQQAAGEEAPFDKTPPQPYAPPEAGQASLSAELAGLALSDEEAAEAGMSSPNGEQSALDTTPPQPFAPPHAEPDPPPPPLRRPEVAAAAGVAGVSRRAPAPPPPAPPPPAKAPAPGPAAAPAEKTCANCGAANPPAAKFCFDCGTPFIKKTEPPAPKPEPVKPAPPKNEPPPSIQIDSSLQVDVALAGEEISDSTAESRPVSAEELAAEEAPAPVEEAPPPEEEAVPAESVAEHIEEEPLPPFAANLIVEKGSAQGTSFPLAHMETSIGGSGTHVELAEDPFIAPHAATLLFAGDRLVVRDEGSANGVFVRLREQAPLEPGDQFVAGERLFRYDGHTELPRNGEGATPFLGAPRPQSAAVRVVELLSGGRTGRTCHRSGPVIAIGRTGCDMNFPGDSMLAAKHAEIRLGEDGSAMLVDLGQSPSGVWFRLRPQAQQDLMPGDLLLIGDQQLRLEVG